jgi:hypothetical protein
LVEVCRECPKSSNLSDADNCAQSKALPTFYNSPSLLQHPCLQTTSSFQLSLSSFIALRSFSVPSLSFWSIPMLCRNDEMQLQIPGRQPRHRPKRPGLFASLREGSIGTGMGVESVGTVGGRIFVAVIQSRGEMDPTLRISDNQSQRAIARQVKSKRAPINQIGRSASRGGTCDLTTVLDTYRQKLHLTWIQAAWRSCKGSLSRFRLSNHLP